MRIVEVRWFSIKENGEIKQISFSNSTIRGSLKRLYRKPINILLPNNTVLKIGLFDYPLIKTLFFVNTPYLSLNFIDKIIVHPLDFNVKDLTGNELSNLIALNHPLHIELFCNNVKDRNLLIYNYYEGFKS
jgi:hypothetical protein